LQKGNDRYQWIGAGIYTIAEAARLTGVSEGRIRRWMRGYSFVRSGEMRTSLPVFKSHYEPTDRGTIALSFQDLIEVRFVDAFLNAGVSWSHLRAAHLRAAEFLQNTHPFATHQFVTDGHTVLTKVANKALLDIVANQMGFYQIISASLKELEFKNRVTVRWWPMGRRQPVVIDGGRCFGQPIVSKEGVPTAVLHRAYIAEDDQQTTTGPDQQIDVKVIQKVANWFGVANRSVRAAVEYELRLAA
jgi:helix-turn-helix protein